MDDLTRKLIEMNTSLHEIKKIRQQYDDSAPVIHVHKRYTVSTSTEYQGAEVNITNNYEECDYEEEIDDENNDAGDSFSKRNFILIDNDYNVMESDYYIGVNSDSPITIKLTTPPKEFSELIIKLEMGPPVTNRKVTVDGGAYSIDGSFIFIMKKPYQKLHLVCRDQKWHEI